MPQPKTYVGLVRDHSASMRPIAAAAARDYNTTVDALQESSTQQDTIVTVVECGAGSGRVNNRRARISIPVRNSSVQALRKLGPFEYSTPGMSTPLIDSVWDAIRELQKAPDVNDPDVAFLVIATTDGQENASDHSWRELVDLMSQLQFTDRWTFVFRVPRGQSRHVTQYGVPHGNVLEWDQTDRGMQAAAEATASATRSYMSARASGQTSTKGFYTADTSSVSQKVLDRKLTDISGQIKLLPVPSYDHGKQIREFVEERISGPMLRGAAFYKLTKPEKNVQGYKKIVIFDKTTGAAYGGDDARHLLGLPIGQDIRLAPDASGKYDVFVQSTSTNRKIEGNFVLYWPQVGQAFKEGPSARAA